MNATRNSNGGERTTLGSRIKAVFGATTDTTRRPDRRRARFQLEGLEERRLMTTAPTTLAELVTQVEAAMIAPAVAKQVVAGVQVVGLKNSSTVVGQVLSSSNVASVLKQSGLGSVAVTQNLISDTSADVTQILQTELSSNPNLFAAPVISLRVSSSPVVKPTQTVLAPYVSTSGGFAPSPGFFTSTPAISLPISSSQAAANQGPFSSSNPNSAANGWSPSSTMYMAPSQTSATINYSDPSASTPQQYTQQLAQANQNRSHGMDYVVPAAPSMPVPVPDASTPPSRANPAFASLAGLVPTVKG